MIHTCINCYQRKIQSSNLSMTICKTSLTFTLATVLNILSPCIGGTLISIILRCRKIDRILELNRQEKDRARLARLIPKMNSLNPVLGQGLPEMQLRSQLPAPFKVKGLSPKQPKRPIQRLPHYNQELNNILETKKIASYSPVKVQIKQSELYS